MALNFSEMPRVNTVPATSPTPLLDYVALVTGGSRGIGRAAALALAQAGANVAINFYSGTQDGRDSSEPNAEEAAAAIAEQIRELGRRAICLQADVANPEAMNDVVRQTVAEFGRLDIAVSNAAYSERQRLLEADMRAFRRTIDVTMGGAINLLHAAAQQIASQDVRENTESRGCIVFVSSPHASIAVPGAMAYNMSKAAVDHMAKTAAIELAEHRIRINIVHPGWTDTPGERKFASEEQIATAAANLPWGRLAQSEEIARGIVFLCDPASDYTTGATLLIDGGISLPWWANRGSAAP